MPDPPTAGLAAVLELGSGPVRARVASAVVSPVSSIVVSSTGWLRSGDVVSPVLSSPPEALSEPVDGAPQEVRPVTTDTTKTARNILLKNTLLRACADRLATFHIYRFSERSNRLLIDHWHIRYPPIRAAS
jgi:hypothetical protein